jgi:hypothetical protein
MSSIAITAVVLLSGCAENPSGPSNVATGTPDTKWYYRGMAASEYTIYNADELAGLARLVNDSGIGFAGKTIKLNGNISLLKYYGETYNEGKGWIPIGTYERPFLGVFNGNGKVIGGVYINTAGGSVGLFGYIYGGAVKNLGVEDVSVTTTGSSNVGGVAGNNEDGTIDNCYVTGSISGGASFTSGVNAGGIAGNSTGEIINCYSSAAVSAPLSSSATSSSAGGIVGVGSATNCYSTGAVRGRAVGGVVGGGSATNCYSTGAVTGGAATVAGYNNPVSAGGVVGGGNVINCYSTGAVSGPNYSGGVSGGSYNARIINSAALNPSVSGATDSSGRLTGNVSNSTVLSNNAAFRGITNRTGGTSWYNKGGAASDGADITAADIMADGTLGGRFTAENGWTTQNGRLPGLFGETVAIPEHIR